MENRQFYKENLGKGVKFPPQVNKATGKFELVSGEDCIRQSIYLILMTLKEERFLHPDFGSSLPAWVFMEENSSMQSFLSMELERDIRRAEPRIQNVEVKVQPDIKKEYLIVSVDYIIKETSRRDSLVFSFPAHEEDAVL